MFERIRKALGLKKKQAGVSPVLEPMQPIRKHREMPLPIELPANTALVYRSKTPRSLHCRIYIDKLTSAAFIIYKYARYDWSNHLLIFSQYRAEGYANVKVNDGQICINSRKLVEQIFYSKKVEVVPEGRTQMQIKIEPASSFCIQM